MDQIQTISEVEAPAEAVDTETVLAKDAPAEAVDTETVLAEETPAEVADTETVVTEAEAVDTEAVDAETVLAEETPAEVADTETMVTEADVSAEGVIAEVAAPAEVVADALVSEEAEAPETEPVGNGEMNGLAVEDWDYQRPRRGQVRTGVILSIRDTEIIVDVGAKRDGIVPYSDIQRLTPERLAELSEGDEVAVYVLRPEDQDGNLLLSLNMARQEQSWQRAQEMANSGEVWEGPVIGYNKGGLIVPLDDVRGFVPASQVPGFPAGLNQEDRLQRLATLVGETLHVKVIEINRRKRRLILSATAAQRMWHKQQRERLLAELREGEVRRGVVSSLCSFGAFVDLGGADGLIHLSELSWKRVRHPREVVRVGAEVEVYVLRLDHEKNRIGLSLKRLQPEPWALVEDKYELGQLVEGVVTNVVDFGAFAEIEEGIEGLVHVSELTEGQISHPREVVKKGDLLLLRIIRIDTRRKRLGLSLKRVLESEWAEWAARLAVAEAEKEAEESAKAAAAAEEGPEQVSEPPVPDAEVVQEVEESAPTTEEPEPVSEPLALDAEVVQEVEESATTTEEPEPVSEPPVPDAEVVQEVEESATTTTEEPEQVQPLLELESPVREQVEELTMPVAEESGETEDAKAVEEPVEEPELVAADV